MEGDEACRARCWPMGQSAWAVCARATWQALGNVVEFQCFGLGPPGSLVTRLVAIQADAVARSRSILDSSRGR